VFTARYELGLDYNSYYFVIVAPCSLISSKSIIYQQMHFISVLENIKIYIETAPTSFALRPSSGSLHMSLAKVTFIKSVKVRRYGLCGCVAACYIKSMCVLLYVISSPCVCCVLCRVKRCFSLHSTQHTHHHVKQYKGSLYFLIQQYCVD
jgi:hypothetical protein